MAEAPSNDLKLQYLQMQQDCDFAMFRAREANAELKKAYSKHVAGEGSAPSPQELAAIAELERDAEEKYRALRLFVRGIFG